MIVHSSNQKGEFFTADKAVLFDNRLRPNTRFFALWLIAHPADWHFNAVSVANQTGVGVDQVRKAFNQLEEFGYLDKITKHHDDQGHLITDPRIFHENPTEVGKPRLGNQDSVTKGRFPRLGNHDSVTEDSVSQGLSNTKTNTEKKNETNTEKNKETKEIKELVISDGLTDVGKPNFGEPLPAEKQPSAGLSRLALDRKLLAETEEDVDTFLAETPPPAEILLVEKTSPPMIEAQPEFGVPVYKAMSIKLASSLPMDEEDELQAFRSRMKARQRANGY